MTDHDSAQICDEEAIAAQWSVGMASEREAYEWCTTLMAALAPFRGSGTDKEEEMLWIILAGCSPVRNLQRAHPKST